MIHTIAQTKTYRVTVDDSVPVLINTVLGPQTHDEFRGHIQHIVALYVTEAARRPGLGYIADYSQMKAVAPEDLEWAAHYFVPRMASIGLRSMSMVEPEDVFAQYGLDELAETVMADYDMRMFCFKSAEQALSYMAVRQSLTV